MKKYFHMADIVSVWETGPEEQFKEQKKKRELAEDPQGLNDSIFLRSFFFQFLISRN